MARKSGYRMLRLDIPSLHFDMLTILAAMVDEDAGDFSSRILSAFVEGSAATVASMAVDEHGKAIPPKARLAAYRLLSLLADYDCEEAATRFDDLVEKAKAAKKEMDSLVPPDLTESSEADKPADTPAQGPLCSDGGK